MKKALITGVTGQDGSYLAEFLLDKGYEVHGIKRRASMFNTQRVDHLYEDPHVPHQRFVLHYGDLTDSSNLTRILAQVRPDEVYNLGAQSHVAVSFESPEYTADVDAIGALRLLEAIRFLFLGDGARKAALRDEAARLGLANVRFVDTVPKDQVARYWSLLDVSVIHLRRTELFTTVIPSKLFECMGMGIPVLHGVAGESAAIVEREGAGIVFEPENAEQLATCLLQLHGDTELRARLARQALAAAAHYDRGTLGAAMLQALHAAQRGRGG